MSPGTRRLRKRIGILPSLRYGWRLTMRHRNSLVSGTIVFYLPELAQRWGFEASREWDVGITVFKFLVGGWLLWHAVHLSDLETRHSRFHEPVLPAPGYLGRFIGSTLLFWGVLGCLLLPPIRLAGGTWLPSKECLEWLRHPAMWTGPQILVALGAAGAAFPAGLWTVYGWFHGYYVADEGQGAWQSMTSSFQAVTGAFFPVCLFLGVIGAVNALGLALWGVGIFLAFPVTLMATTYVHLQLKQRTSQIVKRRERAR